MTRLHLALHRLLRRVLPRRVREQRGVDMDRTFRQMLEQDGGGRPRLWAGEIRDLLVTGAKLRGQGATRLWRPPMLGASWLDVKMGLRMLAKHPGLTGVAVFALAIGMPVGLAPWHLVNAIEAPLPVPEGQRIQMLRYWNEATHRQDATRLDDLVRWRGGLSAFQTLGAFRRALYNINSGDELVRPVRGAEVTASTFDILRVPPLYGRRIVAADEVPGAPDVVVIGYDLWRSRFGADPEIVGGSLSVGGVVHAIIGVMPRGFYFPVHDELWLPLREQPAPVPFHGLPLMIFGRLAGDVSAAQARMELATVTHRMAAEFPDSHARLRGEVVPFALMLVGAPAGGLRAEPGFYAVQTMTLLLLVVACANVGILIFARTAMRSEELAVRATLGAGRARIVWQMFTESLVLALVAVGVGLLATDQGLRFLQRSLEGGLPYWVDLAVTWETAIRALALAVFSAVVAGVVPALKVTGKSLQPNIQRGAVNWTGIRFGGVSSVLIVADVALAVVIVGMAAAALQNLASLDSSESLGIPADEYLSAELLLPGLEPAANSGATDDRDFIARVAATQQALVQRLEAEPGIRGVAIGSRLPIMDHPGRRVEIEGEEVVEGFRGHQVQVASVDVNFFTALDAPILRGRGFDSRDIGDNRSTVIVNTTFVETVLAGGNPIGRRLRYTGGMQPAGAASFRQDARPGPWLEIIGVVGRLGMNMIAPAQDAGLYHPVAPGEIHPVLLGIHVGDDPVSFVPRLRELVAEVEPNAVVRATTALDEVIQDDMIALYMMTSGGGLLVGILAMLAASGIYAIMSFSVAARTREIGIRISLGAKRRDVVRTISGRAFAQLAVGALLGLGVAWRLLAELQNDAGWVFAYPPPVMALLAGVSVVLLIGMPSCMAPTLRALRIVPTEAIRSGS